MDYGDIDYYFLEDVLNIKIPTKFITPKPKAIENIKLLGDKEMAEQFLQKINDWDKKNYQQAELGVPHSEMQVELD